MPDNAHQDLAVANLARRLERKGLDPDIADMFAGKHAHCVAVPQGCVVPAVKGPDGKAIEGADQIGQLAELVYAEVPKKFGGPKADATSARPPVTAGDDRPDRDSTASSKLANMGYDYNAV